MLKYMKSFLTFLRIHSKCINRIDKVTLGNVKNMYSIVEGYQSKLERRKKSIGQTPATI